MREIELLAPAKDYATAVAAIDWGADAVYIGGAKFGARHAAGNSIEDIARVVEYAHQYGARVHATINTLLFDDELAEAERQARELIGVGVDALIVQDMALRRMNLPVEMHASTQMCNMSVEQAKFLEGSGFSRIILERGLSLEQIREISSATSAEVECFVHGAICVGYSGRCFLSRSMSPRSGNRGECSQACRLAYDLLDGDDNQIIKGKHLLSVKDLNLSSEIGSLIDAGVSSFKIEGRLKDVSYIKNIVGHYRRAVDQALEQRPDCRRSSAGETVMDIVPNPAKSFMRGESKYMLLFKGAGVASFDTPKSVGEFIGRVASVGESSFTLNCDHTLATGDGICFGRHGTNINGVEGRIIRPNRMDDIMVGIDIYRNFDRIFNLDLEKSSTRRVISTRGVVTISPTGVTLRYVDSQGLEAEVVREGNFEESRNREKMVETIHTQLAKSGGTIFRVDEIAIVGEPLFIPSSMLADMRREALEQLRERRVVTVPEHRIIADNESVKYPSTTLTKLENVTNKLAEEFYRAHGVTEIEQGIDISGDTQDAVVLRSGYCIRREIGECLKKGSRLQAPLRIERGGRSFLLEFDCQRCEMLVIDSDI